MKTAEKQITHLERTRTAQADQMGEICELLEWDKPRFCWHQYEQYEEFVRLVCKDAPHWAVKLRYSPVFAGFWKNEWAMRNAREFLSFAWDCDFATNEIEEEYLYINSAAYLLMDIGFKYRFESILKSIK